MEIEEISIENNLYPKALRTITNPPKKLYVIGNKEILNMNSLSIIGSRNSSKYGENITRRFASKLASRGICIVSGMARGIDSKAHIGAMEVRGKTIAVLGSGFNHIFPNKEVFEKIIKSGGAVITEYEPEVEVFSKGFIQRNRIVAGLSLGTLVVEAKQHSGTSITAGFAKKYNRRVFCIPHTIEDKTGYGTNKLLKNGAILVTEPEDILQYFDNITEEKIVIVPDVPEEYLEVYEELKKEPVSVNEISKRLKRSISKINTILTMLELEGYIEGLPGNYFKVKEKY